VVQLGLSEDQELFRATTRRFLETEVPISAVRALADEPAGFSREYWTRGAELGWTAMLVDEADGGGSLSGDGLTDLAVVAEEMGRLVAPGPLVPTNVVASAVSRHGSAGLREEVLPGLLDGSLVGAWAAAENGPPWAAEAMACRAERSSGSWVLNGVKAPVEAGAQADVLLVTAVAEDGPTQFLVDARAPGVTAVPMGCIDLVRRVAEVHLDDVAVDDTRVLGVPGGAASAVEHQTQVAVALQCAETVGATQEVLDFTLEYVADRYSFGRPLSSYQALKHRFADMKMWLEACHGTTTAAVRGVREGGDEAAELVSAAKAYVAVNATEIIQDCIQMHGGIGVTWEHDLHLYLRRATLNRGMYGAPAEHLERIAVLLGMGEPAAVGGAHR
jgi:alkylation response protein AidB-like acyl-CoA dehydrogenase